LSLAGLAAGIYGAAAGFLLGYMLDEARALRAIRRYYGAPDAFPPPPEPRPGLAAAAALVRLEAWPGASGEADKARLAGLFEGLAGQALGLNPLERRELARLSSVAAEEGREASLPIFSRQLATGGSEALRGLLARFGYEAAAAGGAALNHGMEEGLRRIFADAGVGPEAALAARRLVFPGYRDPWEKLGLERGADRAAIKSAFRRLSRRCHPDLAGANGEPEGNPAPDAAAEFRELTDAYEALLK
jgi:DnaJ-domain-containing protein 1